MIIVPKIGVFSGCDYGVWGVFRLWLSQDEAFGSLIMTSEPKLVL